MQRREARPAEREACAEDDPGDVGRMKRQNTGRTSLDTIRAPWSHSLEAQPRRLPISGRFLGPSLRAKRLDGIRALVLIICLVTFRFLPTASAFMQVSAELAHNP